MRESAKSAPDSTEDNLPSPEAFTRLRAAGQAARRRPYVGTLQSIDRWAAAWEAPQSDFRSTARGLPGWTPPLEDALSALVKSCRLPRLQEHVEEQFGRIDPFAALAPRPAGGFRQAFGYPLIGAFLSGGAALSSWPLFLNALLSRSTIFARMSTSDLEWPRLFRQSLARIDQPLADCVREAHWPSEDTERSRLLCESADLVLAHGSDGAMAEIRNFVPPSTPFLPFGSRLSLGIVLAGAPLPEAARRAAVDVAMYDQSGCLSAQSILVEGNDSRAREFAAALDRELRSLTAGRQPAARQSGQNAAIRRARTLAAMEENGLALGPADLRWTVLYSPAPNLPLSPLGQTAILRSFSTFDDLKVMLDPYHSLLQAAGIGARDPEQILEVAPHLAEAGFTRICPLGRMQTPSLGWDHDGRALLSALTRYVDVDE